MAGKGIALQAEGTPKADEIVPAVGASPVRACLEFFEPRHNKGGSPQLGSSAGKVDFQFNPKEVSITKSAKWERKTSRSKKSGPPEYSGAEPCKLSLELFFDSAMDTGIDVVAAVDDLFRCCVPCDASTQSDKPMPYLVQFKWGSVTSFPAFITQVQAKYTRFASNGIPVRAVCTVSLEEIDITPGKQNPTSGSMSADRVHTVVDGDTLALLAYREYGDPQLWRPLATHNGIDDPMRVPAGSQLRLPTLETLLAGVG
ncbi:CIS tube protein [Mycolicibacterium xanthum]|uniref:CIS tube protein n=1 Tax=Mycolicibacterium xanthum TaxID=2796469 RepID=UPI002104C989|nr:peptidase M23 [Mycolicibacterium xanthum]